MLSARAPPAAAEFAMRRACFAALLTLVPVVTLAEQPASRETVAGRETSDSKSPHALALRAVEQLRIRNPDLQASWRPGQAGPEVVTGLRIEIPGVTTPERAADTFLQQNPNLLGIAASDLRHMTVSRSRDRVVVRYSQQAQTATGPLPVLNRYVAVTLDAQGRILALTSDAMPVHPLTIGRVPEAQARVTAIRSALQLGREDPLPVVQVAAMQGIFVQAHRSAHVWAVDVTVTPRVDRRLLFVDAVSGAVVHSQSLVLH